MSDIAEKTESDVDVSETVNSATPNNGGDENSHHLLRILSQGDVEPSTIFNELASFDENNKSDNSLHALQQDIITLIQGGQAQSFHEDLPSPSPQSPTHLLIRSMQQIGGERQDLMHTQTNIGENSPNTSQNTSDETSTEQAMNSLLGEVRPRLGELKEEYIEFIDGLIADGNFRKEVVDHTLDKVTRPVIDFLIKLGKITPEEGEKLLDTINWQRGFLGKAGTVISGRNPTEKLIRDIEDFPLQDLIYGALPVAVAEPYVQDRNIRYALNLAGTYIFEDLEGRLDQVFPEQIWQNQITEVFDTEIFIEDEQNNLEDHPLREVGGFVRNNYEKSFGTPLNPLWIGITNVQGVREQGTDLLQAMENKASDFDELLIANPYELIRDFTIGSITGTIPPEAFRNILMLIGDNKYFDEIYQGKNESVSFFSDLSQSEGLSRQIRGLRGSEPEFDALMNRLSGTTSRAELQKAIREYSVTRFQEGHLPADVFVQLATKDTMQSLVGKDVLDAFLSVLPTQTDEKRNAFTHNKYDRTSLFLHSLVKEVDGMDITADEMGILTNFVSEYGLARLPKLYEYYRNLSLFNRGVLSTLPAEMTEQGISSNGDLMGKFRQLDALYSPSSLRNFENLGPFEMELIKLTTGYATHSFPSRRTSFEQMIGDFEESEAQGSIQDLPEGYEPTTIRVGAKEILDTQSSPIAFDISSSIRREGHNMATMGTSDLYANVIEALDHKILSLREQEGNGAIPDQAREMMSREAIYIQNYLNKLTELGEQGRSDTASLDNLVGMLLDLRADKKLNAVISRVLEQSMIRMAFLKPEGPVMINEFLSGSEQEVDGEKLMRFFQEMRHHMTGVDAEYYWSENTRQKMSGLKLARQRVNDLFSSQQNALREAHNLSSSAIPKGETIIQVIPDRGFVGEMSGYIADACYTKEYPLLTHPLVPIPVKFVREDDGRKDFAGSMLFFEVGTASGEKALMIRALNYPQEDSINITSFTESIFDYARDIADKRGLGVVIVPGNQGALSNYQGVLEYVKSTYIDDKPKVILDSTFDFNGYDITNECFTVRETTQ